MRQADALYRLARERDFDDDDPVCGLPAGHYGRCITEETYWRNLAASASRQSTDEGRERRRTMYAGRRGDRAARYAALRAAGYSRADARRASRRLDGAGCW